MANAKAKAKPLATSNVTIKPMMAAKTNAKAIEQVEAEAEVAGLESIQQVVRAQATTPHDHRIC
eukprot:171223-Alexandrium_andersonii.AAC.1